MSQPYFDFKQFRIYHDRCAMKVGTDGVLLGAWCAATGAQRILDIGAGCGLISLILAQRYPDAHITAVEIDEQAAIQARDNVMASPFSSRIEVVCSDICRFEPADGRFDCIVSNPPFFCETLLPPSHQRSMARNAAHLPFACLADEACRLMSANATFQLILPYDIATQFISIVVERGMSLVERTDIFTKAGKAPKRTLLRFLNNIHCETTTYNSLTLLNEHGDFSESYRHLTSDLYLDRK